MYLKRINRDGSEQEIVLRNFDSFNALKFNLRSFERLHLAGISHVNHPHAGMTSGGGLTTVAGMPPTPGGFFGAGGVGGGGNGGRGGPVLTPVFTKGERHLLEHFDPNELLKGKFLPSQHVRYHLPPPEPQHKRGLQAPWPAAPPECTHGGNAAFTGAGNVHGSHALNIRCINGEGESERIFLFSFRSLYRLYLPIIWRWLSFLHFAFD